MGFMHMHVIVNGSLAYGLHFLVGRVVEINLRLQAAEGSN